VKPFPLTIMALTSLAASTAAAIPIVLPGERRIEIIHHLEDFLSYPVPEERALRIIPDPFVFGREIPTEKPTSRVPGLSDQELLSLVGADLRANIVGFQNFGDRSFVATRDFGLLRTDDVFNVTVPQADNLTFSIRVVSLDADRIVIALDDLETTVPLETSSTGLRPSNP